MENIKQAYIRANVRIFVNFLVEDMPACNIINSYDFSGDGVELIELIGKLDPTAVGKYYHKIYQHDSFPTHNEYRPYSELNHLSKRVRDQSGLNLFLKKRHSDINPDDTLIEFYIDAPKGAMTDGYEKMYEYLSKASSNSSHTMLSGRIRPFGEAWFRACFG